MTRPTDTEATNAAELVRASERWAQGFSAATLAPADASDLVESAQRVARAVARAARELTWLTPDSFVAVMQQAEKSSDR